MPSSAVTHTTPLVSQQTVPFRPSICRIQASGKELCILDGTWYMPNSGQPFSSVLGLLYNRLEGPCQM